MVVCACLVYVYVHVYVEAEEEGMEGGGPSQSFQKASLFWEEGGSVGRGPLLASPSQLCFVLEEATGPPLLTRTTQPCLFRKRAKPEELHCTPEPQGPASSSTRSLFYPAKHAEGCVSLGVCETVSLVTIVSYGHRAH